MKRFLIFLIAFLMITPTLAALEEDEARKALNDAQRYARAGEYEKALERHEWFHENALRIRSSYYGVRLSFALSYWKQLGEKYPPALASLKSIRDAGMRALEAGAAGEERFHDVASINSELGETAATIMLFKSLHQKNPNLAKRCFTAVKDALLSNGEIALFAAYAGNLENYLEAEIEQHGDLVRYMKPRAHQGAGEIIESQNRSLIATALRLIEIANKSGDPLLAQKLRSRVAKVVDDPRLQGNR